MSRGLTSAARSVDTTPAERLRAVGTPLDAGDRVEQQGGRRGSRPGVRRVLVLVDALSLLAPAVLVPSVFVALLAFTGATLALYGQAGLYRPRLHLSVLDELPVIAGRALAAVGLTAVLVGSMNGGRFDLLFLPAAAAGFALQLALREVAYRLVLRWRSRGVVAHRTLVIGGGTIAADLAATLSEHREYGLDPVGYLDSLPARSGVQLRLPYLGDVADVQRVIRDHEVTVLLVAFGAGREANLIDVMRAKDSQHCEVLVVPRLFEHGGQGGDHIGAVPVVRSRRPAFDGPARLTKRLFDVVCSAGALVVLTPVLLACAIAVRLEGGPGVLFRQARVGMDGKTFELLKFRSMKPATATESDVTWNIAQDHRLGPIGRFLRRTSLDELPQLWNILRGQMTIVGPRPERPHFVDRFSAEFPRYEHRHRVPAGLTGLAQVSGLRGDTSIERRARFDNYYIENWSLWLDIKVLVRTLREVVFARGA